MVVNIAERAGSQEMAVALNEGALATDVVKKTAREIESEKISRKPQDAQQAIEKAIEGEAHKGELGVNLLRGFLIRAGEAGVQISKSIFSKKVNQEALSEYEKLFGKKESLADEVTLSNGAISGVGERDSRRKRQQNFKRIVSAESQKEQEINQEKSQILSQFIISQDPKLLKKVLKLDQRLAEIEIEKTETAKNQGEKPQSIAGSYLSQAQKKAQKLGISSFSQDETLKGLREYSTALSEYVVSNSSDLKQKIERLKKELRQKGISEKRLLTLEGSVKKSSRALIAGQIKESLTMRMLTSTNRWEQAKHDLATYEIAGKAMLNKALGGSDFGNHHGGVQKMLHAMQYKAKEEVDGFVRNEVERLAIETALNPKASDNNSEILKLAQKVGFNYEQWLDEVWPERLKDHGLQLIETPPSLVGNMVNTSSDNPRQKNSSYPKDELEDKKEKDLMVNRLRAAYVQVLLRGKGLRAFFKVRKLKGGLFRLGIFSKEFDEKVLGEAKMVAREKTLDMLKEALLEQATLYDLSKKNTAKELIEKKITGLLKNCQKLGVALSRTEFDSLKDTANRSIYQVAKKEWLLVKTALEGNRSSYLEKKEKSLAKILARLRDESSIYEDDFVVNENQPFLSRENVKESA